MTTASGRARRVDAPANAAPRFPFSVLAASLALDLLYAVLLVLLLPWLVLMIFVRKRAVGSLAERLGFVRALPAADRIWIHSVSVGELEAAGPLIAALAASSPGSEIALTTTTASAQELARARFPGKSVCYYPIDFGSAVRRTLRRLRPARIVLMELELWPNLLLNAAACGIPIVVANGRISARGARRMGRVRWFLAPFLRRVSCYYVQNDEYRERLAALGVPAERIEVTGNMKLDRPALEHPAQIRRDFEQRFGFQPGASRWIAGCTHAGEEELLLNVHAELRRDSPALSLLLAPRHVERASEVLALAVKCGFRSALYSERPAGARPEPPEVIVLDETGELGRLYACADVAFVGGSFVPRGGHNIVEPALAGTPILHGPHMENFRELRDLFQGGGASQVVEDEQALRRAASAILQNAEERARRVRLAAAILERSRGASTRTARALLAR